MNIMKLMQQAQKAQEAMLAAQQKLADQTVDVESPGGKIKVTATCDNTIQSISIDPAIIDPSDADFLQDMILQTVNAALAQGKEKAASEMKKITGGLGLPPGMGL